MKNDLHDDFNDFMMYKMVTESDNSENNKGNQSTNSNGCFPAIIMGLIAFKMFELFCNLIY